MRTWGVGMDDFDLVVLGAGAAGMMGALAAAQGGCRVLLVEPFMDQANNLAISGGLFPAAGSTLQSQAGVSDSGEPSLKGFEAIAWNGVLVAAATPRPLVERINAVINLALQDESVRQRLQAAGLEPAGGTPEKFAQLMRDESAKWLPIIRRSGATLG